MSRENIVRAWKNSANRAALAPEREGALPANRAVTYALTNEEQRRVNGGGSLIQSTDGRDAYRSWQEWLAAEKAFVQAMSGPGPWYG